jgi:hypothetical protein
VRRLISRLCEDAVRKEGFIRLELMSTLAGEQLYRDVGYKVLEKLTDDRGGVPVPLLRIAKDLQAADRLLPLLDLRAGIEWMNA